MTTHRNHKRRLALLAIAVAACALATASAAQGAYLTLGTGNTSDAPTTLSGNTAGPELLVKNSNGTSASAFGLYGLLTATSPTVVSAALRGQNNATNGLGFGVSGSHAGAGIGVNGFSPRGVGVRGQSTDGTGVLGQHTAATGTAPGVSASTNSRDAGADALVATVTSIYPGANSAAVRGQNNGTTSTGYGVWGSQAGSGIGVLGTASLGGVGVEGSNPSGYGGFFTGGVGVYGTSPSGLFGVGVQGVGTGDGVFGTSQSLSGVGVRGYSTHGDGVLGTSTDGVGIDGGSVHSIGIRGVSESSDGVQGKGVLAGVAGVSTSGDGIYGENLFSGYAGYFVGNVGITGTCTGCTGPSSLQIDHPLDPAHKYLRHAGVASSDQLDLYSGNAVTDGRGFATVQMPRWFQALNRSFRYQLTVVGRAHWEAKAAVWNEMRHNRFTIRTDQPQVKVSWLVTGIRQDRYANANPTQVIVPKPKADQGKYVHPELFGKPRSDVIGYQKPPQFQKPPRLRLDARLSQKR